MTLLADRTLLVSRAEWGARRPKYTTKFTPSYGTTIHWEGPSMPDFSHDACPSYVRGIQAFHMDARGWADIAYTAVVCPHGYTYEGRWVGNRTGANGTNTGNGTAYAVCFLGGVGDPYTDAADRAMHDTTTHLRRHGGAGRGVNCHRDWKATQCPGDVICGRVKSGRYSTDATNAPTQEDEDDMAVAPCSYWKFPETTTIFKVPWGAPYKVEFFTPAAFQVDMYLMALGGFDTTVHVADQPNTHEWLSGLQIIRTIPADILEAIAEALENSDDFKTAIATAVAKAIPVGSTGGLTEAQVQAAVEKGVDAQLGFLKAGK